MNGRKDTLGVPRANRDPETVAGNLIAGLLERCLNFGDHRV